MVDTSVDLGQLRSTAQQLRNIAESEVAAFAEEQSQLVQTYRAEASTHTLDGMPAGIYADTVATLDAGAREAATKSQTLKTILLRLADAIDEHARGVESDEADSSMRLTYRPEA